MHLTSGQLERQRHLQKHRIVINDLSICYHCKTTGLTEDITFCPNCGFPQRGSQVDMKIFMNNHRKKNQLLKEQKKAVKKARIMLYILSGFYLVSSIAVGLINELNLPILIGGLMSSGIYFGLAVWSKTSPFPAILSGLFVYIIFNVIAGILDPHTIYQGLLWKIIIIGGFIYGYKGVKEGEKLERELNSINEPIKLEKANAV